MPATVSGTSGVCLGCCDVVAGTLECRTRGGTAALCGVSEYTSPSSPPKKYRNESLDTSAAICNLNWDGSFGACAGSPSSLNSQLQQYAGQVQYNASTCGVVNTQVLKFCNQVLATPACPSCTPSGNAGGFSSAPFVLRGGVGFCGAIVSSVSPTTIVYGFDGSCCFLVGPPADYRKYNGTCTAVLSDEDAESDAITRLLAGAGGTWSSYTTVGDGSGGTCINSTCCLAQYEQRTSSFSFNYHEAGFRVTKTGLTPSTSYNAYVSLWRRVYGVGSYTHYSTLVIGGTTDGSGNFSVTGTVTNTEGYQTYAASAGVGP